MPQELPLYQGARPQAPQQQMPTMPRLPHVQGMGEIVDNAISQGVNALMDYSKLRDEGARQEAEHKRRLNYNKMQQDFVKKSNLPPGSEGGFFNAEGDVDEDAVASFMANWQQEDEKIAPTFWLRENAVNWDASRQQRTDTMAGNIGLMLLKDKIKRHKEAFQNNYTLAMEQGDTMAAAQSVNDAVNAGIVSSEEGNVLHFNVQKKQTEMNINEALVNRRLLDAYTSNELGYLSPEQELTVQRLIDTEDIRMLRATRQIKRGKNGELTEEKTAPKGLTIGCLKYWNRLNDPKAPPLSPEERTEGIAAFTAQVREGISGPDVTPEQIEAYKQFGKEEFNIPPSYTEKIVNDKISELKGAKPESFEGLFKRLQSTTPYLNPDQAQELQNAKYQRDLHASYFRSTLYPDGTPIDDDDGRAKEISAKLNENKTLAAEETLSGKRELIRARLDTLDWTIKSLEKGEQENRERLYAYCSAEMAQWEADHPNATAPEVVGKRIELIEKYREKLNIQMLGERQKKEVEKYMIQPQKDLISNRKMHAEIGADQQKITIAATDAAREIAKNNQKQAIDAFNIDTAPTSASSLPESRERLIVYLPIGQAHNRGEIVVELGGRAVKAELRETEAVSEAVFSNKLRMYLGMGGTLCRKPFSVSINNGRAIVAPGRLDWCEPAEPVSLIATPENDPGLRQEWLDAETAEPVASTGDLPPAPEELDPNDSLLK